MQIDDLLQPYSYSKEDYWANVDKGREYCSNIDIVFTGLARNISDKVYDNINLLFGLNKDIFNNVDIVVYENDSEDDTREKLNLAQRIIKNRLHILGQNDNTKFFHSNMPANIARSLERTESLSRYRNICKDYIKNNLSEKKFVIVIDLDFKEISINGLLHSFGLLSTFSDISALAGNAYELNNFMYKDQKTLWNYDSWAFRQNWWQDWSKEVSWYNPMIWFGFWTPFPGLPIIRINSAFGGMAIYRKDFFVSANYEGYDCEHVCFHKNLYKDPRFTLYLNPAQIILL